MSPATSAAAVPTPGVLIRQSTSTLRPLPPARPRLLILPSGTARPLRVATAPRRLPVTAQSAANPGEEPLSFSSLIKITFWRLRSLLGLSQQVTCLNRSSTRSRPSSGADASRFFVFLSFFIDLWWIRLVGAGLLKRAESVQAVESAARVLGECGAGFLQLRGSCSVQWDRFGDWILQGLLEMGIRGVTVSDVRGFGAQGGSTERHGGKGFAASITDDCVLLLHGTSFCNP